MSTTEKISALITDLAEINNGINTEAEIITEIQSVIDNMPTVVGGSYDKGVADGKQAEYNAFWDVYQDNGKRRLYQYAFSYLGWKDDIYKPKYPIKPTSATGMFYYSQVSTVKNIDFSECVNFDNTFRDAAVQEIGVFDSRSSGFYCTFNNAKNLHTIEKMILRENGTQNFTSAFVSCNALENLTIEGTIG